MRLNLLLLACLSIGAFGADFTGTANFTFQSAPTSEIICYTVPSGDVGTVGSWQVSESVGLTPLVPDVDPALFTNADLDNRAGATANGARRCFVVNFNPDPMTAYSPIALNGKRTSRALRTSTTHFGKITVGGDFATTSFTTDTIITGDTSAIYPQPVDPASLGRPAYPTIDYDNTTKIYIDPKTGVGHQLLNKTNFYKIGNPLPPAIGDYSDFDHAYCTGGSWANCNNALVSDGSLAVYGGTTNQPLTVTTDQLAGSDLIIGVSICFQAYKSAMGTTVHGALTESGGVATYGKTLTVNLPVLASYSGQYTCIGDNTTTPVPIMQAWLNAGQLPGLLGPKTGFASTSGSTATLTYHGGSSWPFQVDFWQPGSPFIYNGTPFTIATLPSTNVLTTTASMGTHSDLAWSSPSFGAMIWADGSISIDDIRIYKIVVAAEGTSAGSGSNKFSTNTRFSDGSSTGFLYSSYASTQGFYFWNWINPDVTPAASRYLGIISPGVGLSPYSVDDSVTPPKIYQMCSNGEGGCVFGDSDQHIRSGAYAGSYTDLSAFSTSSVPFTFTDLTPGPTFTGKMTTFDATAPEFGIDGIQSPGTLLLSSQCSKAGVSPCGIQNSMGWLSAYNVTGNSIIGAIPSYKTPNLRWTGLHTPLVFSGSTRFPISYYPMNGATSWGGPYRLTVADNNLNNTTQSLCSTVLSSLGLSDPLGVGSLTRCGIVHFTSLTPITDGSSSPANDTTPGAIILGDTILGGNVVSNPLNDAEWTEWLRVVGIGSCAANCPVVVERAIGSDHPIAAHPSGEKWVMHWTVPTSLLDSFPMKSDQLQQPIWWDYTSAPHGDTGDPNQLQNISSPSATMPDPNLVSASHTLGRADYVLSDNGFIANSGSYVCPSAPHSNGYAARNGAWPNNFLGTFSCTPGNASFDGAYGEGEGQYLDKHPAAGAQVGPTAGQDFMDGRVFNPLYDKPQTTTKIGTYVYQVCNFNQNATSDYKRNVVVVKSGYNYLLNISGGTLTDTQADNWKFVWAYSNGDGYSGAIAGCVYANIPQASVRPADFPSGATYGCVNVGLRLSGMHDICVYTTSSQGDAVLQYSLANDPDAAGTRRISTMAVVQVEPMLADGSYGIGQLPELPSGQANKVVLMKLPTYPGLSVVNRHTWIPVSVASGPVPGSTATAYVKFGYNPSYHCSSRQETCVANSNSIQPGSSVFKYLTSEAPAGLACTSSCNILLPALSQRIIWYQWQFLDSLGASTGTGPVTIVATGSNPAPPSFSTQVSGKATISGKVVIH